jgi:dTDP-glucose pyrophosphorylase
MPAGSLGRRLDPLARMTNKHLSPVYNGLVIFLPNPTPVTAGVRDILPVTGGNYGGDFSEVSEVSKVNNVYLNRVLLRCDILRGR